MTRARLEGMPLALLQELIVKESLDLSPQANREELIETLWDAYEEDKREKEQLNNLITRIEEAKFALFDGEAYSYRETVKEIVLPESYDETMVSLILRDPNWAFVYWDVKSSVYNELSQEYGFKGLILRVFDSTKPHLTSADQSSFFSISLENTSGSQYINLPEQGRFYMVELRGQLLEKESRLLSRSRFIFAPSDRRSYELAPGKEGENQKKMLELSGINFCEATRGKVEQDQKRRIPQRIGDMDDL